MLAKARPSDVPTSRGRRDFPRKGRHAASPTRASCSAVATRCCWGSCMLTKLTAWSWTLDWTTSVPVAWRSARRRAVLWAGAVPGHGTAAAQCPICFLMAPCSAMVGSPCLCALCSGMSECVTPRTVAHHDPLPMGFSRQEHWTGLPFPPPEGLPNPGVEPKSPVAPCLAGGSFTS